MSQLDAMIHKHGKALTRALDVGAGSFTSGIAMQRAVAVIREIADAAKADAVAEMLGPAGISVAAYNRLMLNVIDVELDGTKFTVHLNRPEDAGYLRAWINSKGGKSK